VPDSRAQPSTLPTLLTWWKQANAAYVNQSLFVGGFRIEAGKVCKVDGIEEETYGNL
jgi:hypothetical protein